MELLEKLEDYEFAPSFVARENCPELGLRIYVHKADLRHAYQDDPQNAVDHVQEMYDHWNEFRDVRHEYGFALAWGFGVKKTVDFFLYGDVDTSDSPSKWRDANLDKTSLVIFEGGKVRDFKNCEDSDVILGAEAFYRRTTPNFAYFMDNAPMLGNIGLGVKK